jgi:hypothetical protein
VTEKRGAKASKAAPAAKVARRGSTAVAVRDEPSAPKKTAVPKAAAVSKVAKPKPKPKPKAEISGGPWTQRFMSTLKTVGKGPVDLKGVKPGDVDNLEDNDIFRTLMLEIYGRKKREDPAELEPLQMALFNFDVPTLLEHRDEAAAWLPEVVRDKKKVQAMLQNVLRFASIQERFGSFRQYLIDKVDRLENLEFDLEHRFVGLKPQQIASLLESLGIARRIASRPAVLKVLRQWGAVADDGLTPSSWAAAQDILATVQREVGCTMGALEAMFILFAQAPAG